MREYRIAWVLALAAGCVAPVQARTAIEEARDDAGPRAALTAAAAPRASDHLECVPFARSTSGIQIFGDAHTWWGQAKERYATGQAPRVGAVMAIRPFNNSRLGHVATVSRIIDSRTILLSHANWSSPGQIERNVTALDVSPANDWSQVRIWYAPSGGLGTTHWPVEGFIYNARPGAAPQPLPLSASRPEKASAKSMRSAKVPGAERPGRRSDPIGAIIAGRY